jgi:hypothetical protein
METKLFFTVAPNICKPFVWNLLPVTLLAPRYLGSRSGAVGIASKLHAGWFVVQILPIPVVERSKARVSGWSLAGIAGLNPAGSMDVCVVCVVQ